MEQDDSLTRARDRAIRLVKNDFESGARKLADLALEELHTIALHAARRAYPWKDYWIIVRGAAKDLCMARPAMGASITSCLLRALQDLESGWNSAADSHSSLQSLTDEIFFKIKLERELTTWKLNSSFTTYLRGRIENLEIRRATTSNTDHFLLKPSFRMLTLSNSGTIRNAILFALEQLPDLSIDLFIMESRPRFEGADMAAQLKQSGFGRRVNIKVIPDVAVCAIVEKGIDIALLGADCISAEGNVSNKIGSKSIAASVQIFDTRKEASIIVLSDVDKIAAPVGEGDTVHTEQHPKTELTTAWTMMAEEHSHEFDTFNEWFEWVPAQFIDLYITDEGILETAGVQGHSKDIGELTDMIFGGITPREPSPEVNFEQEPVD